MTLESRFQEQKTNTTEVTDQNVTSLLPQENQQNCKAKAQ